MITVLFELLVIYQLKHLICDYFLQGKYMLGKFKVHGWALPLATHCAVHGVFTFLIALYYMPSYALWLALADSLVHFIVDKVKVEASRAYTHNDANFWWALGIDQFVHHLTHYMIIAMLMHGMYGHSAT